jgi:hypothetical protein
MFFRELLPLGQTLIQQPIAFVGGFVSGLLRLNLNDEPVKSWLAQQGGATHPQSDQNGHHPNPDGPTSITID